MIKKNKGIYTKIPHLRRFVLQNFPFIEEDFDALTDYELLCKVVEYLNDVITSQNALIGKVEELEALFNQLKDFVDHYFDNLDVQDEINKKLDEMAESGTLTEIIAQFLGLGALATFDTQADMIASTNLIKGSKAKTLGKETLGDGFGAYYKIDESGDIELANGLFASLISNYGGNNYYDEITVEQIRRYDTDCYIITIPVNDSEDNLISPSVEEDTVSPLQHADKTFSTLTINGSLSIITPTITTYQEPVIIGNGEILNDNEIFVNSDLANNYVYLGIKADRSIEEFRVNNTTASQLLSAGCINVIDAYYKLVEHGVASDLSDVVTNEAGVVTKRNPRQCLGVKSDGTWIILTCDGRTGNDHGLTSEECQNILIERGVYNAWNLDGGGSTSSVLKGSKINRNIDNNRTTERFIPYTLNFRKTIIDKELAKVYSQIGHEKQNTLEQVYESTVQNKSTDISGKDLNILTDSVIFAYGNGCINRPVNVNGYFINIPHSWMQYVGTYCKQFYIIRENKRIFTRSLINGQFTIWRPLDPDNLCIRPGDAQTLDISHQYVPINLSQDYVNKNSNAIIVNDDNTFSFNTDGYGFCKLDIDIQITPNVNENKFISIARNGVQETGYVWRFGTANSGDTTTHIKWGFAIPPNAISGTPDKYSVLIYGSSGDIIRRSVVNIEIA